MAEIKEAENKIRDLINLVSIYNNEEEQDAGKKIEDEAASELKEKLQEIAQLLV